MSKKRTRKSNARNQQMINIDDAIDVLFSNGGVYVTGHFDMDPHEVKDAFVIMATTNINIMPMLQQARFDNSEEN